MNPFHDRFLDELADVYDAEQRIIQALPKLAHAAVGRRLKTALLSHLEQTEGCVKKIEFLFHSGRLTPKLGAPAATNAP